MARETPDILKKILDYKIEYIERTKRKISLEELKRRSDDCPPQRGFTNSLIKTISNDKPAVIAEIKKASPSKGIICKNFNPDV
ncbi:MAG: indole-3-glycerol-phosphate synthase TrpC, partial [Pseudomonadota bacterium]|nr:indole-3-glycerol-phosphate synthase TrpC [Pseudomonadota bacterium]